MEEFCILFGLDCQIPKLNYFKKEKAGFGAQPRRIFMHFLSQNAGAGALQELACMLWVGWGGVGWGRRGREGAVDKCSCATHGKAAGEGKVWKTFKKAEHFLDEATFLFWVGLGDL